MGKGNDFYLQVAKLQGEFMCHHHDYEDELIVRAGEFLIVPRATFALCPRRDGSPAAGT